MTPDEHDNPDTAGELRTTELYPFSGHPRALDDTMPDIPAMEPLPDPYALPDPGYPEMPEPAREDASDEPEVPPAPGLPDFPVAPGTPDFPVAPGTPDFPAGPDTPAAGSADGPGSPSWPHPLAWTRGPARPPAPSFRPAADPPFPPRFAAMPPTPPTPLAPLAPPAEAPGPAWPADPYAAPRTPDNAPPLRGPSVPWSEVRSAADYEAAPEPLAAPPSLRPRPHPDAGRAPWLPPGEAVSEPPGEAAEVPPWEAGPVPPWESGPVPVREAGPVPPGNGGPVPPREGGPVAPREGGPVPPWDDEPAPPRAGGPVPSQGRPAPPSPSPEVLAPRPTSDMLTSELLLPGKRATPDGGWRRTVFRATGGLIRVGESSASMRRRDLVNRIRTPVDGGHHRVAVLSLKGGVGKTTVTVGLGGTLASLRGDRVIAVDGNPDRGTLSDKVQLQTRSTIRDLLNERALVSRYADVRSFTSQAPSRLEILASDRDPGVSVAFSADDYRAVAGVLEHYYSICITDCGTGLLHSAMAGILELADQVVLVSSPSVDGARSASATLDWLEAHEYGDLVRGGVVVLSNVRRKSRSTVDLDRLEQHFAARCRAVVRVPYDTHLEEGAEVELDYLASETAEAYLTLAALVADGFAHPAGR